MDTEVMAPGLSRNQWNQNSGRKFREFGWFGRYIDEVMAQDVVVTVV